MYINQVVTVTMFALMFSIAVAGQTAAKPATMSKTEAMLRKLDLEEAKAFREKNEAQIARFFTKDSVVNNPRNRLTHGSAGVIDVIRAGINNYSSYDRNIESVQILGDTAVLMGNEKVVMSGKDNGPGETILRRYTNIWMKTGKSWQIVARHASVICK